MSELTAQRISYMLRQRGLSGEMNAYGFPLNEKFRLERGSGIAGRGSAWAVTHIQTGERWRSVTTGKELSKHLDALFKEPKRGIYRGRHISRRRSVQSD